MKNLCNKHTLENNKEKNINNLYTFFTSIY